MVNGRCILCILCLAVNVAGRSQKLPDEALAFDEDVLSSQVTGRLMRREQPEPRPGVLSEELSSVNSEQIVEEQSGTQSLAEEPDVEDSEAVAGETPSEPATLEEMQDTNHHSKLEYIPRRWHEQDEPPIGLLEESVELKVASAATEANCMFFPGYKLNKKVKPADEKKHAGVTSWTQCLGKCAVDFTKHENQRCSALPHSTISSTSKGATVPKQCLTTKMTVDQCENLCTKNRASIDCPASTCIASEWNKTSQTCNFFGVCDKIEFNEGTTVSKRADKQCIQVQWHLEQGKSEGTCVTYTSTIDQTTDWSIKGTFDDDPAVTHFAAICNAPVGIAGQRGQQGAEGTKGTAGKDGKQGQDGKDGPEGAQGEKGPNGAKGETGPQGDKQEKADISKYCTQGLAAVLVILGTIPPILANMMIKKKIDAEHKKLKALLEDQGMEEMEEISGPLPEEEQEEDYQDGGHEEYAGEEEAPAEEAPAEEAAGQATK